MTEAEWQPCHDPTPMLAQTRSMATVSGRRLRSRRAVDVAELFAEKSASRDELTAARRELTAKVRGQLRAKAMHDSLASSDSWDAACLVSQASTVVYQWGSVPPASRADQAALLRDVLHTLPSRVLPTIEPIWLTWRHGTVPRHLRGKSLRPAANPRGRPPGCRVLGRRDPGALPVCDRARAGVLGRRRPAREGVRRS
jgi:hypothetical protein